MAQIEAGQKLKDYVFDTAFESDVKLSDKVKNADKTILLFLRYYGCRICQLDMREYAEAYDRHQGKECPAAGSTAEPCFHHAGPDQAG